MLNKNLTGPSIPGTNKQTFDELLFIIIKSIYSLKLSEFAFDLFENEAYQCMHKSWYPSLALMNLMLIQERYDDVVKLFERNLKIFSLMTKNSSEEQILPKHHLTLVCEALLIKGDREAFEKLKKVCEIVFLKRCQFNNIGSICKASYFTFYMII